MLAADRVADLRKFRASGGGVWVFNSTFCPSNFLPMGPPGPGRTGGLCMPSGGAGGILRVYRRWNESHEGARRGDSLFASVGEIGESGVDSTAFRVANRQLQPCFGCAGIIVQRYLPGTNDGRSQHPVACV